MKQDNIVANHPRMAGIVPEFGPTTGLPNFVSMSQNAALLHKWGMATVQT